MKLTLPDRDFSGAKEVLIDFSGLNTEMPTNSFTNTSVFSFFIRLFKSIFSNDLLSETANTNTKQAVGDRKGTPHILHELGLWTAGSAFVPAVKKGCMLVHKKGRISL